MTKPIWKTVRDDKDAITVTNRYDDALIIRAGRLNPAPRGKWQGWNVAGFDERGTFFRSSALGLKKDAIKAVNEAKRIWEIKNVDKYRLT